jgi:hypothetical protein
LFGRTSTLGWIDACRRLEQLRRLHVEHARELEDRKEAQVLGTPLDVLNIVHRTAHADSQILLGKASLDAKLRDAPAKSKELLVTLYRHRTPMHSRARQ